MPTMMMDNLSHFANRSARNEHQTRIRYHAGDLARDHRREKDWRLSVPTLTLQRAPSGTSCTLGALLVIMDDGSAHRFVTLELPWRNNIADRSRIVPGTYRWFRRHAHETRHGYDVFQLRNVPGRTDVQIHIGNFPKNTDGCILIGSVVAETHDYILGSGTAYAAFMALFAGIDDGEITIIDAFVPTQ